jgi:hypothetical protein
MTIRKQGNLFPLPVPKRSFEPPPPVFSEQDLAAAKKEAFETDAKLDELLKVKDQTIL